jgi:hypothetical protein
MPRKQYIVGPHGKGEWQGKSPGAKRAVVSAPTKDEALRRTVQIAKNQGDTSVVVQKKDGTFQEARRPAPCSPRDVPRSRRTPGT